MSDETPTTPEIEDLPESLEDFDRRENPDLYGEDEDLGGESLDTEQQDPPQREVSGDEGEETGGDAPADSEEEESPPPTPPEDEDEDEDSDLKLGNYPKPSEFGFDPDKLTEDQKPVHDYWRKVLRVKGNEAARKVREVEERFDGLDPDQARLALNVAQDILSAPEPVQEAFEILMNPRDARYPEYIARLQGKTAQTAESGPERDDSDGIDVEDLMRKATVQDDEDGAYYMDPDRLREEVNRIVKERTTKTEAPEEVSRKPQRYSQEEANAFLQRCWNVHAREHDLEPSEREEYGRIYVQLYGNGPPPPHFKDPFEVLDVLRRHRQHEIRETMARKQDRSKVRGSMPPPARSTAAAPPRPEIDVSEMSLEEVDRAVREGRIKVR